MELAAGDYVRYKTGNGKEAEGYIIDTTSVYGINTAWKLLRMWVNVKNQAN